MTFNAASATSSTNQPEPFQDLPLVDIGVNLLDEQYDGEYRGKKQHATDRHVVLARARAAGVKQMIVTAGSVDESRRACALACSEPGVYCTVGVHPTRTREIANGGVLAVQQCIDELEKIAREGMSQGVVCAIGECGLDYDRLEFSSRSEQLALLEPQLKLASRLNLPLFLHDRNTNGELLQMLKRNNYTKVGGVVHSFTGSLSELEAALELGLHIGINGCSLKNASGLGIARRVPANRLLLETDAPWCGVKPTHASFPFVQTHFNRVRVDKYEGTLAADNVDSSPSLWTLVKDRNEPCCLRQVLEAVASCRQVSLEELSKSTTDNAQHLFLSTPKRSSSEARK